MLSFFAKKSPEPSRGSKHDAVTRTNSQFDEPQVTYGSRDRKKDIQFVCHLPTGSRHSAQAQQLAGQIYTGVRPPQSQGMLGPNTTPQQQLLENPNSERHREVNPKKDKREADARLQQMQEQKREFDRYSRQARMASDEARDKENRHRAQVVDDEEEDIHPDDSVSSVGRHAPVPKGAPAATGFRKQSATHTTHYMEGNGRQLFVSAPNDSQEARLFDDVAARASIGSGRGYRIQGSEAGGVARR